MRTGALVSAAAHAGGRRRRICRRYDRHRGLGSRVRAQGRLGRRSVQAGSERPRGAAGDGSGDGEKPRPQRARPRSHSIPTRSSEKSLAGGRMAATTVAANRRLVALPFRSGSCQGIMVRNCRGSSGRCTVSRSSTRSLPRLASSRRSWADRGVPRQRR